MKVPILDSERLIYRPISLEHLSQDYVDWLNDPQINMYLETKGGYTLKKLMEFLRDIENKQILFWGIHLKSNLQHIGNIKIDPVNVFHGTAEYGIMMGQKTEWGKGYAKEATIRIIRYCFEENEIRKITLGVIKNNINAVMLYKKIGFKIEGTLVKQGIYNGVYCDAYRMAIFNPKFDYED